MAKCWNRLTLIGNVGQEPKYQILPSGQTFCRVSLATSRLFKDTTSTSPKEETEWHTLVGWGKTAEFLNQFAVKGCRMAVVGHIHYHKHKDQQGNERVETQIVVEDFIKMERGDSTGGETMTLNGDSPIPFDSLGF